MTARTAADPIDLLQVTVDTIPIQVWRARGDGFVEFLNRPWLDYTGLSFAAAEGWGWQAALHPDEIAAVMDAWRAIVASGRGGELELRLRRADGAWRWFLMRAEPVTDRDGTVIGWCGANTDIEARRCAEDHIRRTEDSLRQAQAQLAQVTRVTTLGEMTASIAHEVNQPLAAILTNAEAGLRWLARPDEAVAETRRVLDAIVGNAERASAVIRRIRDLARRSTPELRPVEIGTVVEDVLLLVACEAHTQATAIRTELGEDLPLVRGDPVQLQQVLINLIINGMEAMADLTDRPRDLLIRTRATETGDVLVEVADVGVGIAPAAGERLFDPFFTTKPQGMGMGLSICRSIVEAHGGRIGASANDGPGITVRFTLPPA